MVGVGEDTGCHVTMVKQEVDVTEGKTSRSDRQGSATQQSSNLAGRRWRTGDGPYVALYCGDGSKSTSDVLVKLERGGKKPVIVQGELAKMTSEVIVNTTSTQLKLDQGAVSMSILMAAGPEIQRECYQYHHGVKWGEVAVTHGYKLKCESVFHGALPQYSKDQQLKCMILFMWNCLKKAEERKYKTISFPALGTGILGYPRDKVAHTMFDTVNNYFQERPDSYIECVNFVVYPRDKGTIKAFEDEDKKQKERSSKGKVSVPTHPVSEKTGVQLRYGNVDLWVTLGQIEKTTAEGLIIFWDSKTLYETPLQCSYFNETVNPRGVKDLQDKRTSMVNKGELVVTVAGTLSYKSVIHCLLKEDNHFQLETVMSVLTEADNCKLSSVALSLSKTGLWTRSKQIIVNQFHDALKQFEGRNKTLRYVEIISDSPEIYNSIESLIRSSYGSRLVESEDIPGATGGVRSRREALEETSHHKFAENSTQMSDDVNLVVSSKSEGSIEKAIQQLKDKINDLQVLKKQQLDQSTISTAASDPTPPPRRKKTHTETKPLTPEERDPQSDSGTILTRSEYEERRLLLTSNSSSPLDKGTIENWMETVPVSKSQVVCPFQDDNEALIILQSVNDAEKLLKRLQGSVQYTVKKFPSQTVQNLKAALKKSIVETIQKHLKPDEITSEICNASGAALNKDENGTWILSGSLPEIQCAYRYIVSIVAGGNGQYGNQNSSHGDRSGAGQGDRKEDDIHSSRENEQNRQPKADDLDGGPRGDTTRGGHLPNSHYDTNPKGKRDDPLSQNTVSHSKGQEQALYTENQQTNEPNNRKKVQKGTSVGKPVDDRYQSVGDQHEDIRSRVHTGSPKDYLKGSDQEELKKICTKYNEKECRYISEEEQIRDGGNADLINRDGNHRHGKVERQEQSLKEHELGREDNVKQKEVDYDNMSMYNTPDNNREGRGTDRQGKHSDGDDKTETLTCSSEQFQEICFFNPGIAEQTEVTFNNSRTECNISYRFGRFRNAKDQLRQYARREIRNLTYTEEQTFQHYYEREKLNMDTKKIFCKYNHMCKQIQLVGENEDVVEKTAYMLSEAIGRPCTQPDQQTTKHCTRRKKSNLPPSGSEVLHTKDGSLVFVYQGDLLNLEVDAIVYGTNCRVDDLRGLSAEIAQAAGSDFLNACRNVFHKGNLNVSDCCCTTAGNLHYDYIIHAVIPMWSAYKKTGTNQGTRKTLYQDDLCRTIMNALKEAVNVAAKSLALPAIGYGEGKSDDVAAAFSDAVKLFSEKYRKSSLKQIHIVDQNSDILKKIKDELLQAKEWNHTTPPVTTRGRSSQHVSGAPCVSGLYTNLSNYPRWMAKSETGRTCMLSEKLNVCIVKGTYVNAQASALVSIEDEMFQSKRFVAREIAKAAGEEYKKEIDKLRKNKKKYQISDVVCTGAGAIQNVRHVFHVIGPVADKDISGKAELFEGFTDNIRACISRVLQKVDEKKLESIVLPSFASGTLQHGQTEKVWEICIEEVEKFAAKQSSKSTLRTIFLVGGPNEVQFLLQIFDSKITHTETVV
ncbi:uncharacterized protein LOC117318598 isoform X2 [Pecten maximus]|uniref:uncharacterized protein LOC117318598 isoform X2 n=1 Tax=Pecten maximus TaxID=6579 RepID=UPI001458D02E|nr:uncharacterized protein LOC117318598 isoform X2 [Pecten maximus]